MGPASRSETSSTRPSQRQGTSSGQTWTSARSSLGPPATSTLAALQDQVDSKPAGRRLSFRDLHALSRQFHQVPAGLFLAPAGERFPGRSEPDSSMLDASALLIAALDSAFWLVAGPDTTLARVVAAYPNAARTPDPGPLSTWGRDT